MAIRTCVICGKEFDAVGNQRYCSTECAAIGNRNKRKSYLQNHPERLDWQREYNRKHRAELKAAEAEIAAKSANINVIDPEAGERHKRELKAAAEGGDLVAKCMYMLLEYGKTSVEYWEAFRERELDYCEQYGSKCVTTVNDFPVDDDLFALKVSGSIQEMNWIRIERKAKS